MSIHLLINIILIALVALTFAAMYRFRWRDFPLIGRLYHVDDVSSDENLLSVERERAAKQAAGISLVVPVRKLTHDLSDLLSSLYAQDYPLFEIIVAEEFPTRQSGDVLKNLRQTFSSLRYTQVPLSSRGIDRRKAAITFGFRAAHYEWVVLTESDCRPLNKEWLLSLSRVFQTSTDIVIGYSNFEDDYTNTARRASYERLREQLSNCRAFLSRAPFTASVSNLVIRKSFFLHHQAFADSLRVPFGEISFFISRYATKDNTALVLNQQAKVERQMPSPQQLSNERVISRRVRRKSGRLSRLFAFRDAFATCCLYLFLLSAAVLIALRVYDVSLQQQYDWINLCFDAPLLTFILLAFTLPSLLLKRSTEVIGERRFGFYVVSHALMLPFRQMSVALRSLVLKNKWVLPHLPLTEEGLDEEEI